MVVENVTLLEESDLSSLTPEVSPGFTVSVNNESNTTIITATAINPTGGEITLNDVMEAPANSPSSWTDLPITFINNTKFNLKVGVYFPVIYNSSTRLLQLQLNEAYDFPYVFNLTNNTEASYPLLQCRRKTGTAGSETSWTVDMTLSIQRLN